MYNVMITAGDYTCFAKYGREECLCEISCACEPTIDLTQVLDFWAAFDRCDIQDIYEQTKEEYPRALVEVITL